MAPKRVTFIGNPDDPTDGRASLTAFGVTYLLNRPRDVELTASVEKKLSANRHFTVEAPPTVPLPNKAGPPLDDKTSNPGPQETESSPEGDQANSSSAQEPITVQREKARNKK